MKRSIAKAVKFHATVRNVHIRITAAATVDPKTNRLDTTVQPAPATPATPAPVATNQLASLLSTITDHLDDLQEARSQNLTELQEVSIELGVAIASHLLRSKLDAGEFKVEALVREAIDQFMPDDNIVVKVNHADLQDLGRLVGDPLEELRSRIDLAEDAKLPRGACFVGTSDHGLLSSFESRLENIRETLLEGIQYARVERRKPIDVDGSLRRFPDRRKPA